MDIKEVLLLWFLSFLIKSLLVEQVNPCQMNIMPISFIKRLLKIFKKEEFILHLKTIFGVLVLLIWKLISNFNEGIRF